MKIKSTHHSSSISRHPFPTSFACAFLFYVSFIQASANPVASKPALPTVVAGQRIGKMYLGYTPGQVHKILGKPNRVLQLKGGYTDDLYSSQKQRTGSNGMEMRDKLEVLYLRGRVVQIEATSPRFVTAQGLSTNSSVRTLTTKNLRWSVLVYGYESEDSAWENYYLTDVRRGLTIEFQGWQEQLMWRSYPTTLIVHRVGKAVVPDAGGKLVTSSTDISVIMSEENSG